MTTQPQPAPKPAKSRLLQDGRDMFWSIAPLVLACIVLAGLLGMCSFQASGPGKGPAPSYDAPAALQADADALKIPIRLPLLPEGWQSNSGSRQGIEKGRTDPVSGQQRPRGQLHGGLPGAERHVREPDAEQRRRGQAASARSRPMRIRRGSRTSNGVKWVVYEGGEQDGRPAEPVWTTRLNGPAGPGADCDNRRRGYR